MIRPFRRALVVPVLLIAPALLAGDVLAQSADGAKEPATLKEPESGIAMATSVSVLDGAATHHLTGMALREKTFLEIDVYVAGHYVDAAAAREELAKWTEKDADELADDDDFRAKLLSAGFARTLRLTLARDIDSEDFNDAFEESLEPRMKRFLKAGEAGKAGDVATLKGFFSVDELAEGTNLDFTWKDSTLTVAMDGEKLGAIDSAALCRSLWDVYFGEDPIQDHFPKDLMKRFPGVLAVQKAAALPDPDEAE